MISDLLAAYGGWLAAGLGTCFALVAAWNHYRGMF